jgi:hypothetical protein
VRQAVVLRATVAAGAALTSLVLAGLVLAGLVLAGLGPAATLRLPLFSPPGRVDVFGYVTSVTPRGRDYRLRFDPAFFLTGLTATAAAVADGAIGPGQALPNDYYVRNPEHSLLTFRLPADTHVTVLANLMQTKISVAYLRKVLRAKRTTSCGRFELVPPCRLGFWLRYSGDTVLALDQQYQP